jgi:hypothetical protein
MGYAKWVTQWLLDSTVLHVFENVQRSLVENSKSNATSAQATSMSWANGIEQSFL